MAGAAGALLAAALVLAAAVAADAAGGTEADVLLAFMATLRVAGGVTPALPGWSSSTAPCTGAARKSPWQGVRCDGQQVYILQLEDLGLQGGAPDLGMLAPLRGLRSLSLAGNNLTGAFPDLIKLPNLKLLYLSRNGLAGEIPDTAFAPVTALQKLHLEENAFAGPIPRSLASLPRLLELDLSDNNFSGPIPEGLRKFDAASFKGNKGLCGPPLGISCTEYIGSPSGSRSPSPAPSSSSSGSMKILMIIAIVVVVIGAILAVVGVFAAVQARRNEPRYAGGTDTLGGGPDAAAKLKLASTPAGIKAEQGGAEQHGGAATPASAKRGGRRDDHGRLVFVQEGRHRFELEDLLRASAEVLGSGNFGASYKATLLDGPSMVVKRFKAMNAVGREEFAEHMRRLGRLAHPNLLPVVAYLYKKDEKLLVTDYMVSGSLAHLLHGGARSSLPPLDWPKRLKIIKGVARGLAHLYDELPMLTVPHGHLKSSNVLLDAAFEPVLSDYALVPVITPQHAAQVMVAYKSPECAASGRASRKSDVWSLGILVLEVLTGKFPANFLRQGRAGATDLAGWVHSVVREEWTGEVFDKDMRAPRSGEGEMVKLLKVGLGCCEPDVARRWDIAEALARIEELRERDAGDDSSTASSFVSDGEAASRHGDPHSHSA
ncbi:hypothetical protein ACP70R_044059 [Stipagrostis hirtigluma subsp. patula]